MNKVILMGRLTRDPEVRQTQGTESISVARFTIAVDRKVAKNTSDSQKADFINCVSFGKKAEFTEKYLKKGTKIVLCGRIQTGSYANKDGNKVYTTDIVAEDLEFAESKQSQAQSGSSTEAPPPMTDNDGFINIPDGIEEDLPFS